MIRKTVVPFRVASTLSSNITVKHISLPAMPFDVEFGNSDETKPRSLPIAVKCFRLKDDPLLAGTDRYFARR